MDNFTAAILIAASLTILATMFGARVLSFGWVRARYRLGEDSSDAIVKICFSLVLPLFTAIFIVAPHAWPAQDFRNSAGFHGELIAATGIIEVLVLIGAFRAFRKWRRG